MALEKILTCVCGLKIFNTHWRSQHAHTQTYVYKYTRLAYTCITVCDQPLYRSKGAYIGSSYVRMDRRVPCPQSAVSVLLNYSLSGTQSACYALSVIKHVYNGT